MTLETRKRLERQIARATIKEALAAGYTLGVFDCEEITLENCADARKVFAAMFTTDDDKLLFYRDGKRVGWVWFVYGNSGHDVVCDYTTNLDAVLEPINKLSDKLAERYA
jgi:hypothetical protein